MLKKTFAILISLLILSPFFSFTKEKKQQAIRTIIIDAGHGIMKNGGYNGAKGTYSYEDEICYAVSKKLVAKIRVEYPNIKIIETRPTENIVALKERANIANHNRGDYLFPFT